MSTEQILTAVDRRSKELVEAVQALVRIPSVTGSEQAAQLFMEQLLRSLGFAVTTFEADAERLRSHPEFVANSWPYAGRPNVIGRLEGADPSAPGLILNGHIDVVSPEPLSAWTQDPWGGQIAGDRLYGRGAWDMKGGLLAGVFAARALLDAGLTPMGSLTIQSVIEEEAGGGGGTLACLSEGHLGDAMICVEPLWATVVAHPGILYFRVRVTGKTAHAGRAHTGVNAIGKLNRIYDALAELDRKRAVQVQYPLFQQTFGRSCHLNVGTYRAGDWPSTVAGWGELECRISFVPGERREEIQAEVERTVAAAAAGDEWLGAHPPVVEWFGWKAQPWVQEQSHPIVSAVQAAAEQVGRPAPIAGKTAGMDTRFASYFGMAAISFGPDGGGIHGADEFVSVSSLIDSCKVLALTASHYSGARA